MKGSFATMQQNRVTEVTFYYVDGAHESFTIPIAPTTFEQQLPQLLQKPWLTFHLLDQSVLISTARIMKIEVKPSLSQLQGEGVFFDCQRVTALSRGAARS